jgi:hypothetical protein
MSSPIETMQHILKKAYLLFFNLQPQWARRAAAPFFASIFKDGCTYKEVNTMKWM